MERIPTILTLLPLANPSIVPDAIELLGVVLEYSDMLEMTLHLVEREILEWMPVLLNQHVLPFGNLHDHLLSVNLELLVETVQEM